MWSSSIPSRSSAKPEVSPKRAIFSSGLLATNLPLLPRLLQLSVALRMDLLLPPSEHVLRRDVACGAVQPDIVVTLDVTLHQSPRIIERQWRSRPDAPPFERFVPALDLSVRLRVKRRGPDVRHPRDPDEFLEVLGDELRPIVRDDPGPRLRVLLLRPLYNDLDVRLGHRLPDVPVHDVPAEAIQDAAQVVERPADVEVGNVDMPVLMRDQRLRKACALFRRLPLPLRQESGLAEHSPNAGRAH